MPRKVLLLTGTVGALALSVSLALPAFAQASDAGTAARKAHAGVHAARAAPGRIAPTIPVPDIPFNKFVLPNGLTVIHVEDKRTPTVTVQVWYRVGSKNEPKGRSGFAHLFEHLMFNGSEHFNDDWFKATEKLGATDLNGTTDQDRTNYYQTVPKGALDSILWLESDRMGYLAGAIDKAKLDEQRKVVQNEKRQGENQPLASVSDHIMAATQTPDHPYGHSTIGSMEDLNAASLDDVKQWFRDWYGPNNAVLVLAGDLTLEEAKAKVAKYFGEIPGGKPVSQPVSWIQKLSTDQREVMQDRTPATQLFRVWNVPGYGSAEGEPLDAIASALAGDRNARLTRRLVYQDGLATKVGASNNQQAVSGQFTIQVMLKPGVDVARVEAVVNEELAKLLATGPTAAELAKAKITRARSLVDLMESVPAKANLLATGELYGRDPADWRASVARADAVTPVQAAAIGRKWLEGGSYTLVVDPFPDLAASSAKADRSKVPEPAPVADAVFPAFKTFRLSNGIEVWLAERHDAPKVTMQMTVRTGVDPDYRQRVPGAGALTFALLDDGTTTRTGTQLADEIDRLGGTFGVGSSGEEAVIEATSLTSTLAPMLGIWADVIRHPAFRQDDLAREQERLVQSLRQSMATPTGIAATTLSRAAWGADHPYGRAVTAETAASVKRDDVTGFYQRWFGPNHARIIVVGDTTEAAVRPMLEKAFAGWAPAAASPMTVPQPARPAGPVVYLVDQPGAVQTVIRVGSITDPFDASRDDSEDLFNSIIGGGFTSRINMNLREVHGWSYGAFTGLSSGLGPRLFSVTAPVQTDATKDALVELKRELADVVGTKPPTSEEFEKARNEAVLGLTGRWATADAVAGSLAALPRYNLPSDYWSHRSGDLRAVTLDQVVSAGRRILPDDRYAWVIVGDLSKIEADVRALKLGEVQVLDAEGKRIR